MLCLLALGQSACLQALLNANYDALRDLLLETLYIAAVDNRVGESERHADNGAVQREEGRLQSSAWVRRRERGNKNGRRARRIDLVVDGSGGEDGALVGRKREDDFTGSVARSNEAGNQSAGCDASLGDDE